MAENVISPRLFMDIMNYSYLPNKQSETKRDMKTVFLRGL